MTKPLKEHTKEYTNGYNYLCYFDIFIGSLTASCDMPLDLHFLLICVSIMINGCVLLSYGQYPHQLISYRRLAFQFSCLKMKINKRSEDIYEKGDGLYLGFGYLRLVNDPLEPKGITVILDI